MEVTIGTQIDELFTMIEMYEKVIERIIRLSGGKLSAKDEVKLDEAYAMIDKFESELIALGVGVGVGVGTS